MEEEVEVSYEYEEVQEKGKNRFHGDSMIARRVTTIVAPRRRLRRP